MDGNLKKIPKNINGTEKYFRQVVKDLFIDFINLTLVAKSKSGQDIFLNKNPHFLLHILVADLENFSKHYKLFLIKYSWRY